MAIERTPEPGMLVMGVLWGSGVDTSKTRILLSGMFGPVSRHSETVPFEEYTDYYEKEMGTGISRCFLAFGPLFPRGALAEAKLGTNRLERQLSRSGKRVVNLDPGIVTPEALILASTKPHYHRVYLSKGIYAELTLVFRGKGFDTMPWTYPDYQEVWARSFFNEVRGDLMERR
jgi:hypothetical protein